MKRAAAIAVLVCLFACSAPDKREPTEPTDDVRATYDETVERLLTRFLERGQIVSRGEAGEPRHQGDSLLWTGMALGVLPCASASVVADALGDNVRENAGHVVRFRPLPAEYVGGREASLDGELGILWGLTHYTKRCGTVPAWFTEHYATLSSSGWIYPNAARLPLDFPHVLDVVAHIAGLRDRPDPSRGDRLGAQVAAWAAGVVATKAAAYRIHLGWLALSTLEASGEDVGSARNLFCAASNGAGMPLINEWCGKNELEGWLSTFEYNVGGEYQHQRAGWESNDAKQALETPGLDRLVALTHIYDNLGGY